MSGVTDTGFVLGASIAYVGLLFGIAHWADRRAARARSVVANPYVYALSLAVYATSWTFYGSVGRAAESGVGFLPIYLGPTLAAVLFWLVLRKMIRVSRRNGITSLSDFAASRYGNSQLLGALVAVIAVVGVVPYISLQLKAISTTFVILGDYPALAAPGPDRVAPIAGDTALYVALLLAAFAILFGCRRVDAAERHEGLVAAIAFESVVKLIAFLAVGVFVTFGLFGGFGDLFDRAESDPRLRELFTFGPELAPSGWTWLVVLSMLAILLLPRQFQVAVVENIDERHVTRAMWLLPLYLVAINVFVLPVALAGLLRLGGSVDPDTFVLTLPMSAGAEGLALLAFLGGLSAATGMVIVESVALSTMVSNSLVMPVVLGRNWRLARRGNLGKLLLRVRRATIVLVLLLGYAFFRAAGESTTLVSMGLLSFAAVAQFAPTILGGLFWKGGTRNGAVAGLVAGFAVWTYTLLLPTFARSGWLPGSFVEDGPFGIALLRPERLLGLESVDAISHGMFWSALLNVGLYFGVSLLGRRTPGEHAQAALFVDVFRHTDAAGPARFWRGTADVGEVRALLERFVGADAARAVVDEHASRRGIELRPGTEVDADFLGHVEQVLAGAVGSVSARIMVGSLVEEEPLGFDEVLSILDEASKVRAYSRELERKSRELEAATAELRAANERLQELDRLKDDFVSTVSHELRTPLTSIRAFSEILLDNPDLELEERERFLGTIVEESGRLSRLINQVLDLSKLESGRAEWHLEEVDLREVLDHAAATTSHLLSTHAVELAVDAPEHLPPVVADRDRVTQVILNLLSNAAKFSRRDGGRIDVRVTCEPEAVRVDVRDNGPGIAPDEQERVFERFHQVGDATTDRPQGTGLGLPISREIISRLGGQIWVESVPEQGATFSFTLPFASRTELTTGGGRAREDPHR